MDRQKFLALRSKPESVNVSQWGETVYLRVMSGADRLTWADIVETQEGKPSTYTPTLALLVRTLCDENGTRLFGDTPEDMNALNAHDSAALDFLRDHAMRINGLSPAGREEAKKKLRDDAGFRFLFELAGYLKMTVGELVHRMDSFELTCWQERAGFDPFGESRDDWRAALVASTVANMAGKHYPDWRPTSEYMLKFEANPAPEEELDVETKLRGGFARIMAAQNAGRRN